MITAQLLVYHYNGIHNNSKGMDRDVYVLKNVEVSTKKEFQQLIADTLNSIQIGKGYVLVKWDKRLFICEKDSNLPQIPYIRQELKYHPLMNVFDL